MGLGWKIWNWYEENPMTIEEWEKLNKLNHDNIEYLLFDNIDNIEIDWETGIAYNKPVDFCVSMCCYAKINRTDNGDFCTRCGSRMS